VELRQRVAELEAAESNLDKADGTSNAPGGVAVSSIAAWSSTSLLYQANSRCRRNNEQFWKDHRLSNEDEALRLGFGGGVVACRRRVDDVEHIL
jgi:hypothetical protein